MKNKKLFLINLIYFIAIICVAIVFALGYLGVFKSDILSSFLIQIVVMFAIPLLLYTLFVSKNVKKTFTDAGFRKISASMIGISIVLGVVLYFINSFVADFFQSFISMLGYENIGTGSTVTLNYEFLLKEFVLSAIFPAFCEEFLHRGIMLHAGKKCGNVRYSLIISSILFGLMHLNINQFFYATIMGFMMGYVAIISDSIFPSMIIHFMNNFLSLYFTYGYYLDWPLASIFKSVESFLMSNVFLYVFISSLTIFALIYVYFILTKQLLKRRARMDIIRLINELKLTSLTIEEAQAKVNLANDIVEKTNSETKLFPKGVKFGFNENFFLISSFVLGTLITISSFIWGIL